MKRFFSEGSHMHKNVSRLQAHPGRAERSRVLWSCNAAWKDQPGIAITSAFSKSWWDSWFLRVTEKTTTFTKLILLDRVPPIGSPLCASGTEHEPCFVARQTNPGNSGGLGSCLPTTTNTSVCLIFYFSIQPLKFCRSIPKTYIFISTSTFEEGFIGLDSVPFSCNLQVHHIRTAGGITSIIDYCLLISQFYNPAHSFEAF